MIALNPTASVEKKVQETKRKLFSEIPDPECIVVLSSNADLAYANDQNQIYISARKYRALPSENARTFVAAHELGHLKRKHPIKTWQLRASLEKITGKLTKEMNREIQKFVRATELEADLEAMLRGGVSIATGAEEFHEDDEQQTLAYTTMDDHPSPQARKGIAQLLRAELELLRKMNG